MKTLIFKCFVLSALALTDFLGQKRGNLFVGGSKGLSADIEKKELIQEVETDTIDYRLWLVYDKAENPVHYYAEIFTPVCYSNKCYPVNINFTWDLLGNYQKYSLPQGEILTKSDHYEFEKADYDKLQEILQNETSILKNYKAEDLVVSTGSENPTGVDAVTGATLKTIRNEVIEGAVYSCYTLWHIAHGTIRESINSNTAQNLLNKALLKDFLQSPNYHYQYWAMEKTLIEEKIPDPQFVEPLLSIIRNKNVFASKHLLKKLPGSILEDPKRQLWLCETYLQVSYPVQMALLKKFGEIDLSSELVSLLVKQLGKSNTEQKKEIFALLKGYQGFSASSKAILAGYLEDQNWQKEVFAILNDQSH